MNIYEETTKNLEIAKKKLYNEEAIVNKYILHGIARKVLESGCYKCEKGSKGKFSYCFECGQILKDAEERGLI